MTRCGFCHREYDNKLFEIIVHELPMCIYCRDRWDDAVQDARRDRWDEDHKNEKEGEDNDT